MKQIKLVQREIATAAGTMELSYELLEAPCSIDEARPAYTAVISAERGAEEERAAALEISTDPLAALGYWEQLVRGEVTPVTLFDTAEDFLGAL